MAQLTVSFTIKGERKETIFILVKEDIIFSLKGYSEGGEFKTFPLEQDKETKIFTLKNDNVFEEDGNIIKTRLVELSEEYVGAQSEGVELEDDMLELKKDKPGYGPENIYVENKPFSISMIMDLIEDGDLEVAPNFQRNFVWDRTRQSKLIESILLGLPLPSIYLSQYSDGKLTIVDGLQRIRTIQSFMNDELELCNMEYFEKCNGKKYSQLKEILPLLQFRRFRQTQIMCFVIDYRSPEALKFDLFRRLNTGGKALNDQEIRNCLSRPQLQALLKEMVSVKEFSLATNDSVNDARMAAQEMALRFIYFYEQYREDNPIGEYNGEMRGSLDAYVEKLNRLSKNELSKYIDPFRNGMQMAFDLFGKHAFRKISRNKNNQKNPINKPLMLAISVLLAKYYDVYKDKVSEKKNLENELAQLLDDDSNFLKVITTSTTHKTSILYTISTLKEKLFDKYLLNK